MKGFETTVGVKQDCFCNYSLIYLIHKGYGDYLHGIITFNDLNIKLLAFAGDNILIAADKFALKNTINNI